MRVPKSVVAIAVAGLLSLDGAVHAAGTAEEWTLRLSGLGGIDVDRAASALSPDGVAVGTREVGVVPGFTNHRLVQASRGVVTSEVDFEHEIARLVYSPDGTLLLAEEQPPGVPWRHDRRLHLLRADGTILWSRLDPYVNHYFSMSGKAIYSHGGGAGAPASIGRVVEVFDLSGVLRRRFVSERPLVGALVPDTGGELIVASESAIARIDISADDGSFEKVIWRFELDEDERKVSGLRALATGRFAVECSSGTALIMDPDGNVVDRRGPVDREARLVAAPHGCKTGARQGPRAVVLCPDRFVVKRDPSARCSPRDVRCDGRPLRPGLAGTLVGTPPFAL